MSSCYYLVQFKVKIFLMAEQLHKRWIMGLSFLVLMIRMENKNFNVTIRQRIIENSVFDCFTFLTIHSKRVSFLFQKWYYVLKMRRLISQTTFNVYANIVWWYLNDIREGCNINDGPFHHVNFFKFYVSS